MSARSTASIVVNALGVWTCDFLCMLYSLAAVHAAVPWDGVLPAYGAAEVVSALPIVPGGLGIVEGSVAVILAAYGIARVPAISAALAYRLVSFWLAIAVGWASVGVIVYQARRRHEAISCHHRFSGGGPRSRRPPRPPAARRTPPSPPTDPA